MILTFATALLLFNAAIYMTIKYIIYPVAPETTTVSSTTTTTTTTASTAESTTAKSFGRFLIKKNKNRLNKIVFKDLGCFFDQTNITLADGSIRPLNRLTTGEEVLVYSSLGQLTKSRILTIFHHQRSSVRFLDIYTTNNLEPLRLTPSHSILTKKTNRQQNFFHYDFAYNIVIGDFIYSSELEPVEVVTIKEIILYNQTISTPLTFEGNIIVNNLIGSCYATYTHKFMHLLTTPIRYWYQIEIFSRFNYFLVHFIDLYSTMNF